MLFVGSVIFSALLGRAAAPDAGREDGAKAPDMRRRAIANERNRRREAIDPERVEWIEAENAGARIFTRDGSRRVPRALMDLEGAWADRGFLRISASVMVNVRRIKELRIAGRRRRRIVLGGGRSWLCEFPYTLPLDQMWRERTCRGRAVDSPGGIGNRVPPGI